MSVLKDYIENYDNVIWDWNGTIIDDIKQVVKTLSAQLQRHGLRAPTEEEYRKHFKFPISEFYEILGFDLEKKNFEELSKEYHLELEKYANEAKVFKGLEGLLSDLKEDGVKSYILSAAPQTYLDEIVEEVGLSPYFEALYGLPHGLADSKVQRGLELMADHGINPEKTLLIGDTLHDLEVGKELGVKVLLIADGHQSHSRLSSAHDFVLSSKYK
jgi:phosphoglycolate phosphatase